MSDGLSDYSENTEEFDDGEKLDDAFREMEMIYRSRCVDVPLGANVKVIEIEESDDDEPDDEQ